MDAKAYKRCEYLIRSYLSMDDPPPELTAASHRWLLNERNCREKDVIIQKMFEEALADLIPEQEKEENYS